MKAHQDLARLSLLASLLTSLTAAIVACGSETTAAGDAGDAEAQTLADANGRTDGSTDARADALPDGSPDATGGEVDAGGGRDACISDGDGGCLPPSVRRPFLVGSSMRSAQAVAGERWVARTTAAADDVDDVTRAHLAALWLRDALEEHASVAAFARLTLWMMHLGAPPSLLVASQRAGIDEIAHARSCFELARRYGGHASAPTGLPLGGTLSEVRVRDIVRIAAEEGCVGETLGAALAAEELRVVTDPEVRRVLAKLARDEARHAELAWSFAAWAVATYGAEAREAFREGIARAIAGTRAAPIRTYPGVDGAALRAHGRLDCREAREIAELAIARVVLPSAAQVEARAHTSTTPPAARGARA